MHLVGTLRPNLSWLNLKCLTGSQTIQVERKGPWCSVKKLRESVSQTPRNLYENMANGIPRGPQDRKNSFSLERMKKPFPHARNFHSRLKFHSLEIKGRFRKRVVLANVPSFRFSFRGNIRRNHLFGNHPFANPQKGSLGDKRAVSKGWFWRTYPRSGFRSGGTSAETTLLKPPFATPDSFSVWQFHSRLKISIPGPVFLRSERGPEWNLHSRLKVFIPYWSLIFSILPLEIEFFSILGPSGFSSGWNCGIFHLGLLRFYWKDSDLGSQMQIPASQA